MVLTLVVLAVFGMAMASFAGALTWRIRKKKDWIKARSQCESCGHQLAAADLIPFFSWLALRGRCRYCKKAISWQLPATELGLGIVFAASYYFWPGGVETAGDWVLFITWLATAVGLLALFLYDARWMLLPNKILYPTLAVAAAGRLIYLIGFEPDKLDGVVSWILAVAVASGIFLAIYIVSKGKWIGFGDVRLGLVTGTVLADPLLSFLMIMIASVLGVLFALPSMISGKKNLASQLPFGPFLIVATAISLIFGPEIVDWYKDILIP